MREHDSARHVGDEPLLLAEHAPVAVTPNRAAGAALLAGQGCDFLIMDDGFQSARIAHRLCADRARRALWRRQWPRHSRPGRCARRWSTSCAIADAVLTVGEGKAASDVVRKASRAGRPFFEAHVAAARHGAIAGRRFLAFAGIGHPEKFFDTVTATGATVVARAGPSRTITSLPRTNWRNCLAPPSWPDST